MRIDPPIDCIPAYVRPVPVVPLSSEVSKALIASGVFQHNPNHVLWAAPGHVAASVGVPMESTECVDLAGGIRFQPRSIPKSDDSLLAALLDVGKQSVPILEQSGLDGVAEGAALLVATPDILHALTSSDRGKAENVFLYATSLVKLLKIVNHVALVPHAEESLEVVATIFNIGEQVFIA